MAPAVRTLVLGAAVLVWTIAIASGMGWAWQEHCPDPDRCAVPRAVSIALAMTWVGGLALGRSIVQRRREAEAAARARAERDA